MLTDEDLLPIRAREFDWFAVDVAGELALMCTAGYGPVTASVLEHHAAHSALGDALDQERIRSGGIGRDDRTEASLYAALGLHVFDWGYYPGPGPYSRQTTTVGVLADTLRQRIGALPGLPRLEVRFATTETITADDLPD